MIRHHKRNLEARLASCMDKRYHLESLNVTQMHIRAVRTTTKTFAQFLEVNDVERVEALQETLTDMISDACEISETLEREGPVRVDEEELEEEYRALCSEIQVPAEAKWVEPVPDESEWPEPPTRMTHHGVELELVPLTA